MVTYKITFMDGLSTNFEGQSYYDIADSFDSENIYKVERVISNNDLQKAIDLLTANCSNRRSCEGCYFKESGTPCSMLTTLGE